MLGCLCLLLNIPVRSAELETPGVFTSISKPRLLDLTREFPLPSIDGSLCLRLKFPVRSAEFSIGRALVRPLLSARSDSTLLDLTFGSPRPKMLG
jgi:hypothetical protein